VSESAIGTPATAGNAPSSLAAAIGQLFGSGRDFVADAADLVAAEAQVALQVMTALVVSAVCGAVLGVLAAAGILAAIAMVMIERGFSGAAATGVVALVCAVGAAAFIVRLRSLTRHALFARSRQQLRGDT
jgi:hypothetical protein